MKYILKIYRGLLSKIFGHGKIIKIRGKYYANRTYSNVCERLRKDKISVVLEQREMGIMKVALLVLREIKLK